MYTLDMHNGFIVSVKRGCYGPDPVAKAEGLVNKVSRALCYMHIHMSLSLRLDRGFKTWLLWTKARC